MNLPSHEYEVENFIHPSRVILESVNIAEHLFQPAKVDQGDRVGKLSKRIGGYQPRVENLVSRYCFDPLQMIKQREKKPLDIIVENRLAIISITRKTFFMVLCSTSDAFQL